MKIVILHTRLSGYLAACLREFKRRTNAEMLIYCWPSQPDAPFDANTFADLGVIHNRREHPNPAIEAAVRAFHPDAILTSGWVDSGYMKICRALRYQGIPVIAGCDTQWNGSLRQHLGSWIAPWHLRKAIDVLWVTGERQAVLARALGFNGDRLWDGYYACDWSKFGRKQVTGDGMQETGAGRVGGCDPHSFTPGPRSLSPDPFFLFVGRYVPEKGLDTLAEAYRIYCDQVEQPWKLVCAGAGPLQETMHAVGAEDRGFVQPSELPALMHKAAAFILPSRFEPWGVVAHEAAASGIPLILSDACGASAHLLRHLYNGYRFPAGEVLSLAHAMITLHQLTPERRQTLGLASHELSKQYTPQLWAETLVEGLGVLKRANAH